MATVDRFEARDDRAHQLLAEASLLLLRLGGEPSATSTSSGGDPIPAAASDDLRTLLQAALDEFESALVLAPHLRPVAWQYGVALLYAGRLEEASEQFACWARLDRDDAEPWLWRFLCIARMEGLKAARQSLEAWQGYDARLCMAQVLELYKGETTLEEVLDAAGGDRHSAARASFAAALYHEARGEGDLAQPLLAAVARLDVDGDLSGLARCHLAMFGAQRPSVDKGKAAEERKGEEGEREEKLREGNKGEEKGKGKGKGAVSFLQQVMVGAWGSPRTLSLDSSSGESTASISTTEGCCCAEEEEAEMGASVPGPPMVASRSFSW